MFDGCWLELKWHPPLAVGRVQQLSTIGFAALGLQGHPLRACLVPQTGTSLVVGSSFTNLHRQVSRL